MKPAPWTMNTDERMVPKIDYSTRIPVLMSLPEDRWRSRIHASRNHLQIRIVMARQPVSIDLPGSSAVFEPEDIVWSPSKSTNFISPAWSPSYLRCIDNEVDCCLVDVIVCRFFVCSWKVRLLHIPRYLPISDYIIIAQYLGRIIEFGYFRCIICQAYGQVITERFVCQVWSINSKSASSTFGTQSWLHFAWARWLHKHREAFCRKFTPPLVSRT